MLALLFLITSLVFSQDVEKDTLKDDDSQRITFSTIPNDKQKSLDPFYKELKKAAFGVQRFSIFEQLAEEHMKKGDTDSILKYGNLYQKELGNWDKSNKEKNYHYAKANYIMGFGYIFNGLHEKSTEWFIKGVQKAQLANFQKYEYKNKIGLAKTYLLKDDPDKAISTLEEALPKFSTQFSTITNKALVVLGNAHLKKQEYEKADNFFNQAAEMATKFNDVEMELTVGLEKAKLAEAKEEFGKAFQGYEETRNRALKEGYTAIYFEGSLLLAKYYFKEEMYETANIALMFAQVNAIDRENLLFQREALEMQARAFAKQDDYKNGYAVITQLFQVLGEINTKQKKAIIKELEVQYETLEKEKEISKLEEGQIKKEAELKRQKTIKNAFLIGFLIILIPVMALLYVYYQKIQAQSELAKKQEEINTQKVESLKQEQELNLIKASIEGQDEERKRIAQELHDSIGGNLAGIKLQFASMEGDSEKLKSLTGQIDETYQLVRDISHTLIPKKFKENVFTQLIQEYIKSISNTGELEVAFHPHPEKEINAIDEKHQMEIYKIIQELMTNTLKHAAASRVDIHLSLIENELSLLFEDNGKGFETANSSDGIGFQNIKNRIKELSGILHIDSTLERGTVVSIEIPIKTKES
ncbi:ATP-binding protein [Maribacter sp. 2308TA10-17]|uniref:tetratricopeptide repeat-containing sensor histidine kinase n=1 Tax=Maribacter sp. 2308TA10-17 TaxID=3386276 RepID=UPI0039BC60AC